MDDRCRDHGGYYCPVAREDECPQHGGFDVCCDRPELHQSLSHRPCCSSHDVNMDCEKYRLTHFVEVRPCCTFDRAQMEREAAECNDPDCYCPGHGKEKAQ